VSVDPIAEEIPYLSSYNYAGNKPITAQDLEGLHGTEDNPKGADVKANNPSTERVGDPPFVHAVQEGENLTRIADKYGVSVDELVAWNDIDNPDNIETGLNLYLSDPSDYLEMREMTVAEFYGIEPDEGKVNFTFRDGEIVDLKTDKDIQNNQMIELLMFASEAVLIVSSGGLMNSNSSKKPNQFQYTPRVNNPFPGFSPGKKTFFSGVYNTKNQSIAFQPSGDTRLSNGTVPKNLVDRSTGHRTVLQNVRGSFADNAAFTMNYRSSNHIHVTFKSGSVNSQYNRANGMGRSSMLNEKTQKEIVQRLRRAFPGSTITY